MMSMVGVANDAAIEGVHAERPGVKPCPFISRASLVRSSDLLARLLGTV
jgi:hypothetical protein